MMVQNNELQRRIDELVEQLNASQASFQKLQVSTRWRISFRSFRFGLTLKSLLSSIIKVEFNKAETLRAGAEQRVDHLHQENESVRHQLHSVGQKLNEYYADMATTLDQASQASQTGRASRRQRVCRNVKISVVAVSC